MKKLFLTFLFILMLLPVYCVDAKIERYYNDPIYDFTLLHGNMTQLLSPLEPIDITSIGAHTNSTHILISIQTSANLEPEPISPQLYSFSLVMFADSDVQKVLKYEIFIDDEYGWSMFRLLEEPEKVVVAYDGYSVSFLIARDIIDLGGNPETLHFLVWTMYDNPKPSSFQVMDTAPNQDQGWMPPTLGFPMDGSEYYTFALNETDISEPNENTDSETISSETINEPITAFSFLFPEIISVNSKKKLLFSLFASVAILLLLLNSWRINQTQI